MRVILLTLFLIAFIGCAKKNSTSAAPAKPKRPPSQNSAGPAIDPRCAKFADGLAAAGIEKVKTRLDQVVSKLTGAEVTALMQGARIYRRARPSQFSDADIKTGIENAIAALNQIGEILPTLGLVKNAPRIDVSEGQSLMMKNFFAYPAPLTERDRPGASFRDIYDGIPYFGLSVGDSTADAGFSLIGEIDTRIEKTNFVVSLIYTAVTKSYIIASHAYLDDMSQVNFESPDASCSSEPRIQAWAMMARAQENMTDCESKSCKPIQ